MSERGSLARRGNEGLAARRKARRRKVFAVVAVLLLLVCGAAVYGLWQPQVRIHEVAVAGLDESYADLAREELAGRILLILPRDSIFFFPEERIRERILSADLNIAAVSISRDGFGGLTISAERRSAVAAWCGLLKTGGALEYCYLFDSAGLLYASAASTTPVSNRFSLYAPLEGEALEPLGATLAHADAVPTVFEFVRALTGRGGIAEWVRIYEDEVTVHLISGTRVLYVLGEEQAAFAALTSAKEVVPLSDGSVEYVDLRFPAKVYLKRKE